MGRCFKTWNVRYIIDNYWTEKISFNKMVEMLNEIAEEHYNKTNEKTN